MGYKETNLWLFLEEISSKDHRFLVGVEEVCDFAIVRALTIQNTFPNFTLHNETHVVNVLELMYKLLDKRIKSLTTDEAAMLVLAACCHDIGMSFNQEEKNEILSNSNRLEEYLLTNPVEYTRVYSNSTQGPVLDDQILLNFFRSIHHERTGELLRLNHWSGDVGWPKALQGRVDREYLISVCQSHCQNHKELEKLCDLPFLDLRMCSILLRLADILDFDHTRTPESLFDYLGKSILPGSVSETEWLKHMSSSGFRFDCIDRTHPYKLPFCSNSRTNTIGSL